MRYRHRSGAGPLRDRLRLHRVGGRHPDYAKALAGSPPPLAALHRQANKLLPGGSAAYEDRIAALRGYPVVVNIWASWKLTKQGIIAREQNDQFQTLALAADKAVAATRASIESAKAAIQGAEAKLGEARLQLNYATIRAPISGRAGTVSRKTGNIVSANGDALVIINQLSPVYASFTVPEQSLPELRRYAAGGKLRVHAMPQGAVSAADGAEGVLDFLDNTVDTASGTILLKAKFPNKNRQLWPGQFVNVSVRLANPTETVVPSSAVRTAQQGSYVFVVKPDSTAEQRTIETARSFDELTVVQSGLKPGEKVIVEGQLRVKPGSKVRIQQPKGEADRARTNSD